MLVTELEPIVMRAPVRPIIPVREVSYRNSAWQFPWPAYGIGQTILTAAPLVVADLLAITGSLWLTWLVASRFTLPANPTWSEIALGLTIAIYVANLAVGLYPGIGLSTISEIRRASTAAGLIAAIFLTVSLFNGHGNLSIEISVVATCALLTIALPLARSLVRLVCSYFSWWGQRTLIVGSVGQASSIYSYLLENPRLGLRPVGIVADLQGVDPDEVPEFRLGPLARTRALAREHNSAWLIVARPNRPRQEIQKVIKNLDRDGRHQTVLSCLDGSPSVWRRASACLDWPGTPNRSAKSPLLQGVKRCFDLLLTIVGGTLLLPGMLVIAALIKLDSPGPAIFRQERVGRHGRRFLVWKFRTMVCNGEQVLNAYLDACPERRAAWNRDHKLPHDPRITRVGRILRKTSLDELPQLWSVLRGDMSLVGPRPILASEIVDFGDHFYAFCSVPPGITGLWQVSGRNQTTYAEHVELDSFYARHWSLWLDMYILLRTVRVVLFRHGAY